MGVSFYYIWKIGYSEKTKPAFQVYFVQLFLNFLWSILFFGLRSPLFGLIGIAFLWISIVANMLAFYKLSKNSAYLLIPYLLWVSFAFFLNYTVYVLNG